MMVLDSEDSTMHANAWKGRSWSGKVRVGSGQRVRGITVRNSPLPTAHSPLQFRHEHYVMRAGPGCISCQRVVRQGDASAPSVGDSWCNNGLSCDVPPVNRRARGWNGVCHHRVGSGEWEVGVCFPLTLLHFRRELRPTTHYPLLTVLKWLSARPCLSSLCAAR
jgi:hypothetical protein